MYSDLVRKECVKCHKLKPITQFHLNGYRRRDGTSAKRNDCKKCNKEAHDIYVETNRKKLNKYVKIRYRKNGMESAREYGLQKRYGISIFDYEALLKEQNNRCALCQKHSSEFSRRFDTDHCHDSQKIRGLLCVACNRGLGLLKDDPEVLKRAIAYLEKYKN